jgi:hypothetical protein
MDQEGGQQTEGTASNSASDAGIGKFGLYSIQKYIPVDNLVSSLNWDGPVSEISALGWESKDTVMDELATFMQFPRKFERAWKSVADCLADVCVRKGRLIIIRGVTASVLPVVGRLVYYAAQLFAEDAKKPPRGDVIVVIEGYNAPVSHKDLGTYNLTPLPNAPEENFGPGIYSVQVSGKRTHTYYVNLALRVFRRRPWYSQLELTGLGNAIPSIVSVAEILKRYQMTKTERIETSFVNLEGDGGRQLQKAKILVLITKIADRPIPPTDNGLVDEDGM